MIDVGCTNLLSHVPMALTLFSLASFSILTTVFLIAGIFLVGELVTAVPDDIGNLDIELNAEDFDADYLFHSDKHLTEQNDVTEEEQ